MVQWECAIEDHQHTKHGKDGTVVTPWNDSSSKSLEASIPKTKLISWITCASSASDESSAVGQPTSRKSFGLVVANRSCDNHALTMGCDKTCRFKFPCIARTERRATSSCYSYHIRRCTTIQAHRFLYSQDFKTRLPDTSVDHPCSKITALATFLNRNSIK